MQKGKEVQVRNSAGEVIRLTPAEQYHADYMQRMVNERYGNALGYEVSVTTLTTIVKRVSEQKYFHVAPAQYLPIKVGEGTWSSNLTTYRSFDLGDEFETGIINTGGQNARLATADAAVDALNIKIENWAKSVGWSIFDLELASKSGNWDLIAAKERARKRNWDLGVQRIAFLGARGLNGAAGSCLGLLNQVGITTNTTRITGYINALSVTALKTFCAGVIEDYRSNCARTAMPTHFIVPESEYNGLASQASPDFPIKTVLDVLLETFKIMTGNSSFKILPLSYADPAYHTDVASIAGLHVYVLLNYDEESLRMDIPLDYTNTLANSLDNFSFQNAAYGQLTGVLSYRPLEMLYYTW